MTLNLCVNHRRSSNKRFSCCNRTTTTPHTNKRFSGSSSSQSYLAFSQKRTSGHLAWRSATSKQSRCIVEFQPRLLTHLYHQRLCQASHGLTAPSHLGESGDCRRVISVLVRPWLFSVISAIRIAAGSPSVWREGFGHPSSTVI